MATDLNNPSLNLLGAQTSGDAPAEQKLLSPSLNLLATPARKVSAGRGLLRAFAQGASFGFQDELAASVSGAVAAATGGDFATTYELVLASEREGIDIFEEENPALSAAANIAGGVATGIAGGARVAARPVTSAVAGGALFGAGTADTLRDVPVDATIGAGLGVLPMGLLKGSERGLKALKETRVGRIIADAAQSSGLTMKQLAEKVKQLGPEAKLVDVLPELGEKMAQIPGARGVLEDFLEARAGGQPARILGSLANLTRSTKNFWDNIDELKRVRKTAASPKYAEAFDIGYTPTPELSKIVETLKKVPQAWKLARFIAKFEDGVDLPRLPPEQMTFRDLDYLKQGLDDAIPGVAKNLSKRAAVLVSQKRDEMLAILDKQNPAYAAAREAYAGPSAMLRAQELGRGALRTDFELSERAIKEMTSGEKEAFVIGAVRDMRDRILTAGEGQNVVSKFKPLIKERLRPAFPDDDTFDTFIDTLESENIMAQVRNQVLMNSRTAFRRNLSNESGVFAVGADTLLSGAGPTAALLNSVRQAVMKQARKGITKETATEVSRALIDGASAKNINALLRSKGVSSPEADMLVNRIFIAATTGTQAGVAGGVQ